MAPSVLLEARYTLGKAEAKLQLILLFSQLSYVPLAVL